MDDFGFNVIYFCKQCGQGYIFLMKWFVVLYWNVDEIKVICVYGVFRVIIFSKQILKVVKQLRIIEVIMGGYLFCVLDGIYI